MSSPQAPPPFVPFFLGRIIVWIVLVCGCALPLVVVAWSQTTHQALFGEAIGITVWIVIMVIVGEQLRWNAADARSYGLRGTLYAMISNRWCNAAADRRSKMLRRGALALMIFHVGLALLERDLGLFLLYAPAIWCTTRLSLIPAASSDFQGFLTLTVMCGAQAAGLVFIFGRLIERGR